MTGELSWDERMLPSERRIDRLLNEFGRFGVDLGLDRILSLLQLIGSPHGRVPMIHVAGTNGKGSVCAYLSSVLSRAGYRVGRYTSPHLVSWCERITIDGQPIAARDLLQCLRFVIDHIDPKRPTPTQFEVFTAAAWLHFAESQVDIAVVEVGLGGRLDATNVVEHPLVSVITSLSRDHWQRLGPTLADIAGEKAGILKPGCPAVIGPLPESAAAVVRARIRSLNCPVVWPDAAVPIGGNKARYGSADDGLIYPLPFLGEHQFVNSAIAIATLYTLRQQGWTVPNRAIVEGMAQAKWPGRLQWVTWHSSQGQPVSLLVDGAHNPEAAVMLRRYVDAYLLAQKPESAGLSEASPVVWLLGMLSTKDHYDVLAALIRPGDSLHLVPVPGHSSAEPQDLADIATELCPALAQCQTYANLREGLEAIAPVRSGPKVLCGSLYLIGHFFRTEARRE